MFDNNITLTGSNSETTEYSLITMADRKSIRRDTTAPLGEPSDLTISHSETKVNGEVHDRHLVRVDRTIVNTDGEAVTFSAYLVVQAPRKTATTVQVGDIVKELRSFMEPSFIVRLLAGEP